MWILFCKSKISIFFSVQLGPVPPVLPSATADTAGEQKDSLILKKNTKASKCFFFFKKFQSLQKLFYIPRVPLRLRK